MAVILWSPKDSGHRQYRVTFAGTRGSLHHIQRYLIAQALMVFDPKNQNLHVLTVA